MLFKWLYYIAYYKSWKRFQHNIQGTKSHPAAAGCEEEKMKKKTIALLLTLAMAIGLTACGSSGSADAKGSVY